MKTQLDAEMIDQVCKGIEEHGEHAAPVLMRLGATRTQASYWLGKGRDLEREGAEPEPGSMDELYLALVVGVDSAESLYEQRMNIMWQHAFGEKRLDMIQKAMSRAQQIAVKMERRFPDRYKRVQAEKAQPEVSFDDLVNRRSSSKTR